MEKSLIIYMAVINILTFLAYGLDKLKAMGNRWRISEAMLIGMAAAGGAYGALIGMYLFHHKTRKVKFVLTIPCLCILYAVVLIKIIIK